MDVVTWIATLAAYLFAWFIAIKIVIAVWDLKKREERIIEQNERQLNLLEQVVNALNQTNAGLQNRD